MVRAVVTGVLLLVLGLSAQDRQQPTDEDFKVYSDPPRLFLRPQRARLLKRERERDSIRWRQFQLLVAGGAPMPEPGFAYALYWFVTGDAAYLEKSANWAASATATDPRQLALVYDWCQASLGPAQKTAILNKLKRIASDPAIPATVRSARDKLLAANAIASEEPALAERVNRQIARDWFHDRILPTLDRGALTREDIDPLYEILHVLRDNTQVDLRDYAKDFFEELPTWHLLSHYPATYPSSENEYRIPVYSGNGEPDLRVATLSRAAELMMVAFDNNALQSQYMQGWLMQDRFLLRSPFGIPYEFMWANPYQPGLPYFKLNPFFHDKNRGILFVRSSWEEDARWFGYFDGQIQLFENGQVRKATLAAFDQPFQMGNSLIRSANDLKPFPAGSEDGPSAVFFLGLKPGEYLDVEIDDQEMEEVTADRGGIVVLPFPAQPPTFVHMRRLAAPAPASR